MPGNPDCSRTIGVRLLAEFGHCHRVFAVFTEDWNAMKKYMCVICGFIYDEAKGLPDEGIEPGTRWDDVPLNWQCPECGAGKEDFEMMEI